MGLQNQIANLMEKLKDLQPVRPARPNVWCTHYMVEGHVAIECLRLRGINNLGGIVGPLRTSPTIRVVAVGVHTTCTLGVLLLISYGCFTFSE